MSNDFGRRRRWWVHFFYFASTFTFFLAQVAHICLQCKHDRYPMQDTVQIGTGTRRGRRSSSQNTDNKTSRNTHRNPSVGLVFGS